MPKLIATKQDWIKLGLMRFTDSGAKGIIVEQMAKTLKVNKSSFYHHFKTKRDFISSLIDYWVDSDTKVIITEVDSLTDPISKFIKLVEITFRKDSNLDFNFYLKKYARNKKNIESLLEEIDLTRINYVSGLLNEIGYTPKESLQKAKIFYKFLIGYHEVNRYKPKIKDYASKVIDEMSHFIILK